jgi:hypothetical protein
MRSRSVRFRSAAAIVAIVLPTTLMAQSANQPGAQVLTPVGYRDSAKVHRVPAGYDLNIMSDGHVRVENRTTGDYTDFHNPVQAKLEYPLLITDGPLLPGGSISADRRSHIMIRRG